MRCRVAGRSEQGKGMITLPDLETPFEHENAYWLTAAPNRLGKTLAHYELFKKATKQEGAIIECGVFKGASLSRFAMLRALFDKAAERRIIGFDVFGTFPETDHEPDKPLRQHFVHSAGEECISRHQLLDILMRKGCDENLTLVEGNILEAVPAYLEENPNLRIALLNLDTDLYEPAKVILEYMYPKIISGGVLLLDDYGVFPGETKAVDDYFGDGVKIRRFPFVSTPCYIVKA